MMKKLPMPSCKTALLLPACCRWPIDRVIEVKPAGMGTVYDRTQIRMMMMAEGLSEECKWLCRNTQSDLQDVASA
jgi:hypothetical protein